MFGEYLTKKILSNSICLVAQSTNFVFFSFLSNVAPGSMGEKKGLLEGDYVVRINETDISKMTPKEVSSFTQAKGER